MRSLTSRFPRILIYGWVLPLLLTASATLAVADEEGSKTKSPSGSPHGFTAGSPHGSSPHGSSPHGSSPHGASKGSVHGSEYGKGDREGSDTKKKEEGSGTGYSHGKSYEHGKSYSHGKKSYGHGKSYSAHGAHSRHGDPFSHLLKFAHKLELTHEQLHAIEDKQFEYKRKKVELYAEHRIQHMDLDRLVHSGELDESAIREVGERMKKTKAAKIQLMIDSKIALLQILTDEQRKKVRELHHHGH